NTTDAEVASLSRSFVLPSPMMTVDVTTTNVVGASSAPVLGARAELVSQVHPIWTMITGLAIDKGIQAGLVSGIDHRKSERGLVDVASYDPFVEARYVSAVLAFHDLDIKILSQLESQKDASIADIMSLLCLEDLSAETLEVSRLQPSYEQLLLPVHRKEDNVVTEETSLSDSLDVVYAHVQKLKEGALSHRLSISDAIGVRADLLSSENIIGKASTLGVPVMAVATTDLAISFIAANISSDPPISVVDYDMPDNLFGYVSKAGGRNLTYCVCLLVFAPGPAPKPSIQDDPSVNSVYGFGSSSLTYMGVARESSSGRSTIKSAKICPLIDTLDL
nr:hypothetical protein [Tanacetum cinerariifolium]